MILGLPLECVHQLAQDRHGVLDVPACERSECLLDRAYYTTTAPRGEAVRGRAGDLDRFAEAIGLALDSLRSSLRWRSRGKRVSGFDSRRLHPICF